MRRTTWDRNHMEYFTEKEFDCNCGKCISKVRMSVALLRLLDNARHIALVPFHITSGIRCPAHNKAVGSKRTSSHLTGMAADIKCTSSAKRHAILYALMKVGMPRVGIREDFIHVDVDPNKPGGLIWLY